MSDFLLQTWSKNKKRNRTTLTSGSTNPNNTFTNPHNGEKYNTVQDADMTVVRNVLPSFYFYMLLTSFVIS